MRGIQEWLKDPRYYCKKPDLIPLGEYCYSWLSLRPGEEPESLDYDDFGITYSYDPNNRLLCPYYNFSNHGLVYCSYMNLVGVMEWGDYQKNYEMAIKHYGSKERVDKLLKPYSGYLYDEQKVCGINYQLDDDLFDDDCYDFELVASLHPLHHEIFVGYFLWNMDELESNNMLSIKHFYKKFYKLDHDADRLEAITAIERYIPNYLSKKGCD